MSQEDYAAGSASQLDDQRPAISEYVGVTPNQPTPNDTIKESPQSRLSLILWGDRRRWRDREATRLANINAGQPEWFQAFFVLWVAFYTLTLNIGSYSFWFVGVQLLFFIALMASQYQRRNPDKSPLHPKPLTAWLQLISYLVLVGVVFFSAGYNWRLPALATYCLLQLWLIQSGGYTREPTKPPLAQLSTAKQWLISLAVFVLIFAFFWIGWTTRGTIWPFVAYCVVALALIFLARPKIEKAATSASA